MDSTSLFELKEGRIGCFSDRVRKPVALTRLLLQELIVQVVSRDLPAITLEQASGKQIINAAGA